MKKNRGFTLIELIGVLVIMALLIMIVFPATVRLMRDNEEQKYNYYYDIILKGASTYASSRRDDLGGINGDGCVDDITLSTLIKNNYVKVFDDEEATCASPSEFNVDNGLPDLVNDLGLTGDYVDIKLTNTNGRVKAEASLICVKGRKIVYQKLVEKSGTCDRYIAEAENVLLDSISSLDATTDDNITYYISGSVTNNYVWYSGKLWRVVSYNKNDRTIKLVTDTAISSLTYNMPVEGTISNFVNSNIYVWLNSNFLKTLNNPNLYLLDATWDYTTVADTSKPTGATTTKSKVGLLNYYEYSKVKGFLNISQNWWLLSKYSDANLWYINSSNAASNAYASTYFGVRPSIVLRANATFYFGADGSKTNPYRLSGEKAGNVGALLNTRFVGEYVSFGGGVYRISEIDDEYVRIVANSNLSEQKSFHYFQSNYSAGTTLGEYLVNTWLTSHSSVHQGLAVSADFCTMWMPKTGSQTKECPLENIVTEKVGLPKIGELFTSANSSGEYWTISPIDDRKLNVVKADGSIVEKDIEEMSGIRPAVNLSVGTKITGGNGTLSSPYTIG